MSNRREDESNSRRRVSIHDRISLTNDRRRDRIEEVYVYYKVNQNSTTEEVRESLTLCIVRNRGIVELLYLLEMFHMNTRFKILRECLQVMESWRWWCPSIMNGTITKGATPHDHPF
jgi:hypothetical protein